MSCILSLSSTAMLQSFSDIKLPANFSEALAVQKVASRSTANCQRANANNTNMIYDCDGSMFKRFLMIAGPSGGTYGGLVRLAPSQLLTRWTQAVPDSVVSSRRDILMNAEPPRERLAPWSYEAPKSSDHHHQAGSIGHSPAKSSDYCGGLSHRGIR